jgi:hypothetical protein
MTYGSAGDSPGNALSILGRGSDRVRPLVARSLTTNQQLTTLSGRLMGWCMRETTGSAGAVVELYDGNSTGSTLVATQGLGNGTTGDYSAWDAGIDIVSGLYAHVVTGNADVVAYFRAEMFTENE